MRNSQPVARFPSTKTIQRNCATEPHTAVLVTAAAQLSFVFSSQQRNGLGAPRSGDTVPLKMKTRARCQRQLAGGNTL